VKPRAEEEPAGGAQAGDQGAPDHSTPSTGSQGGSEEASDPETALAKAGQGQDAPEVEQVADDDVRDGKLRKATLAALTEAFGSDEVRDAAVEQEFGKPLDLVGNRRLSELLQREQAGVTA
jgi:hypothetical protein